MGTRSTKRPTTTPIEPVTHQTVAYTTRGSTLLIYLFFLYFLVENVECLFKLRMKISSHSNDCFFIFVTLYKVGTCVPDFIPQHKII